MVETVVRLAVCNQRQSAGQAKLTPRPLSWARARRVLSHVGSFPIKGIAASTRTSTHVPVHKSLIRREALVFEEPAQLLVRFPILGLVPRGAV